MEQISIEETLRLMEETLAAFGEGGPDPEQEPEAAKAYEGLKQEMIRMKRNLEILKRNMEPAPKQSRDDRRK